MLQESGVAGTLTVRETVDLFRTYYLPHWRPSARSPWRVSRRWPSAESAHLSAGQRQRLYFALRRLR